MATKKSSRPKKNLTVNQPAPPRLPHAWTLMRGAVRVLWRHKKLFLGIALVYIVCNLLLVQTAAATNLSQLKQTLGLSGSVGGGLTLYGYLLSGSLNGASQAGSSYQSILLVVMSLAIIWALREVMAGRQVRIRDSFYKGMYPFVTSLLVLLVIFVQLIPLAVSSAVFAVVEKNGIATSTLQLALWSLLPLVGLCISVYFLISSLFAAYIVTLPDMTPLKALRSAKKLVCFRRWTVLRKLLFMPFIILVLGAVIMLPIILWLAPVAPWLFFVLSSLALLIFHAYMYTLYRELLV